MVVYKKYGEVFKNIRQQKGFKLTSFEHISAAALCKFERGISLLKFDKLLSVLNKVSITLGEYEKCLNNYDLDEHEILIQNTIISIVLNNKDELPKAYKEALILKEQYLALAIKGQYTKLNIVEREKLNDYFEQIITWRYIDLYTLHLSLDWLEVSQILFIVEGFFVSNNIKMLNSLEHRIRIVLIVCRASMILISKGYMEKSQDLLNYISQKDFKHTMFTKNTVNFLKGFWEHQFGTKEKGIALMKTSLNNFDLLSYSEISTYYKHLYEKYSN